MGGVSTLDRFTGSLLGLALGDAVGASPEEEGELRWTDDTAMALGLARALVESGGVDQDALAARWAEDFDPRRHYGGGASRLLTLVAEGTDWRTAGRAIFPGGSYGNGAAMRAAPLGLFFSEQQARDRAAVAAAEITHAHPLGIEGGRLMAHAAALALEAGDGLPGRLAALAAHVEFRSRLGSGGAALGNGALAVESVPTAVHLFERHRNRPFLDLLRAVIDLGGDTDTIGAMAGALWGARRGAGALPGHLLARLEARADIEHVARTLYEARA
jgi:ADP-ribosylglycohydrolase